MDSLYYFLKILHYNVLSRDKKVKLSWYWMDIPLCFICYWFSISKFCWVNSRVPRKLVVYTTIPLSMSQQASPRNCVSDTSNICVWQEWSLLNKNVAIYISFHCFSLFHHKVELKSFLLLSGPILESKGMHAVFHTKKGKKGQSIWKFKQKYSKFESILKKGRLLYVIIACKKLLE